MPCPALPSPAGYHAMTAAFSEVYGFCKPYAITGSLPCIKELQDEGYDVQTMGRCRAAGRAAGMIVWCK